MNWLYPRTALDMIFPGMFWYFTLWIVGGLCVGVWICWEVGVGCVRLGLQAARWIDSRREASARASARVVEPGSLPSHRELVSYFTERYPAGR